MGNLEQIQYLGTWAVCGVATIGLTGWLVYSWGELKGAERATRNFARRYGKAYSVEASGGKPELNYSRKTSWPNSKP